MPLDDLAAAVVLLGLVAYAMFGGADFGAGVWTALASGPRAGEQRQAVTRAIGPVWETNHVWLILIVVALFTAFPSAFADLFVALLVPLVIALIGIVFRGTAFAVRHFEQGPGMRMPGTAFVFSAASIATPLVMGMALGAVAGGQITIEGGEVTSGLWEPWLRPFSILCGLIAVAMCAFLAASYMTTRTSGELREDFRKRALAGGLALGALAIIALPVTYWDADALWDRMSEPAAVIVMLAAAALWAASLLLLSRGLCEMVPPAAAGTVGLALTGWAAAQHPYLILPNERISVVAAGDSTLGPFLTALVVGLVILVPSLALLYTTFSEETGGPGADDAQYEY